MANKVHPAPASAITSILRNHAKDGTLECELLQIETYSRGLRLTRLSLARLLFTDPSTDVTAHCIKEGILFTDPDFPPQKGWKRLGKQLKEAYVFKDGVCADDVKQVRHSLFSALYLFLHHVTSYKLISSHSRSGCAWRLLVHRYHGFGGERETWSPPRLFPETRCCD